MAVAVICEFNPFHNGHAYLLREARRLTGSPVVCIMSGSFTQRGEAAITDKFTRAAIALKNGADLVAELPSVYAVANAQRFAQGGVAAAALLPSVTHLAFGCETDDLGLLQTAADAAENEAVNNRIAALMKTGESYPRAFSAAVREIYGGQTAALLASPNNILAVEYLRALRGTGIQPLPVRRVGAAHDSAETVRHFASGSFLREALQRREDVSAFVPEVPERIANPSLLDRVMLSRLRLCSPDDLQCLPDVGEGLENRILSAARTAESMDALVGAAASPRYTRARIRRILACVLLGITEELQSRRTAYLRPLALSGEGAALLRDCTGEIITSPAKFLRGDGENLPYLRRDILATDMAALAFEPPLRAGLDFVTKIAKSNWIK